MVQSNLASKELIIKIAYYGIAQAGKTSNLKWLYEHINSPKSEWYEEDLDQEQLCGFEYSLPEDFLGIKSKCTVRRINPDILHHHWVQEYLQSMDGIVIIVDSQEERNEFNSEALALLERILQEKKCPLTELALVFQWNKQDLRGSVVAPQNLEYLLNRFQAESQASNATAGEGVQETFDLALHKIRLKLQSRSVGTSQHLPNTAKILKKVRSTQHEAPAPDASITSRLSQKLLSKTTPSHPQISPGHTSQPQETPSVSPTNEQAASPTSPTDKTIPAASPTNEQAVSTDKTTPFSSTNEPTASADKPIQTTSPANESTLPTDKPITVTPPTNESTASTDNPIPTTTPTTLHEQPSVQQKTLPPNQSESQAISSLTQEPLPSTPPSFENDMENKKAKPGNTAQQKSGKKKQNTDEQKSKNTDTENPPDEHIPTPSTINKMPKSIPPPPNKPKTPVEKLPLPYDLKSTKQTPAETPSSNFPTTIADNKSQQSMDSEDSEQQISDARPKLALTMVSPKTEPPNISETITEDHSATSKSTSPVGIKKNTATMPVVAKSGLAGAKKPTATMPVVAKSGLVGAKKPAATMPAVSKTTPPEPSKLTEPTATSTPLPLPLAAEASKVAVSSTPSSPNKPLLPSSNLPQTASTDSPTDVDIHVPDSDNAVKNTEEDSKKNQRPKFAEVEETQKIPIMPDDLPEEPPASSPLEEPLPISLADKIKKVGLIQTQKLAMLKDAPDLSGEEQAENNVTADLDIFESPAPPQQQATPQSKPDVIKRTDIATVDLPPPTENTAVLTKSAVSSLESSKVPLTTKDAVEAIAGLQQGRTLQQCTLSVLNLSRQIFTHPIRIENCVIEQLVVSGAEFHAAVILENTTIAREFYASSEHAVTFRDQLQFKKATVYGGIILGQARVHKLMIIDSKVNKPISMKNGICENGMVISNSQLAGLQIENSQFRGPISITNNTKINEAVTFRNCTMEDTCSLNSLQAARLELEKSSFLRKLELLVCSFDKNVSWMEMMCYGQVLMTDCLFAGTVNGQKAQFHNSLSIRKVSFYQDTSFLKMTCYANCLLDEITFYTIADFLGANFQNLRMVKCTFNGSTNFQEAAFYGATSIVDTQFKHQLNLCRSIWFQKIDLRETKLHGPVSLEGMMADYVILNRQQIEGHLASIKARDYEAMQQEYQILEQIFLRQQRQEDKIWAHIEAKRAARKKIRFSLLHPLKTISKMAEYWFVDLGTGYGTKPGNVLVLSLFVILLFAGIYSLLPLLPAAYQVKDTDLLVQLKYPATSTSSPNFWDDPAWKQVHPYLQNTLTSIMAFLPSGTRCWSLSEISIANAAPLVPRLLMMLENFLGWMLCGMFLLVLLRRILR